MHPLSIVCLCLSYSCLFLGAESQGRAGYPPVAPKPVVRMATGGAGPEEAGQGSPVMMKKMVPVQSSRPQPAVTGNVALQGEEHLDHDPLLTSLNKVQVILCAVSDD